jgi:hypothetical protein
MSDTFSLETVYNIYSDRDGRRISVGPDSDGLELIEIIDHEPKPTVRITLEPEHVRLLSDALKRAYSDAISAKKAGQL